jgi:hypothetical protein
MVKVKIDGKTNKKSIILTSMGCITLLEIVALCNGINGILLTSVIAILAGLGGYVLPQPKFLNK